MSNSCFIASIRTELRTQHDRLLHPSGKKWIAISCIPRDKGYLRALKGRVNLLNNHD
ncbi:MAG: hypothetical protein ACJAZP_000899 [Psychromonas sp.]|jgi:hypothetical protein